MPHTHYLHTPPFWLPPPTHLVLPHTAHTTTPLHTFSHTWVLLHVFSHVRSHVLVHTRTRSHTVLSRWMVGSVHVTARYVLRLVPTTHVPHVTPALTFGSPFGWFGFLSPVCIFVYTVRFTTFWMDVVTVHIVVRVRSPGFFTVYRLGSQVSGFIFTPSTHVQVGLHTVHGLQVPFTAFSVLDHVWVLDYTVTCTFTTTFTVHTRSRTTWFYIGSFRIRSILISLPHTLRLDPTCCLRVPRLLRAVHTYSPVQVPHLPHSTPFLHHGLHHYGSRTCTIRFTTPHHCHPHTWFTWFGFTFAVQFHVTHCTLPRLRSGSAPFTHGWFYRFRFLHGSACAPTLHYTVWFTHSGLHTALDRFCTPLHSSRLVYSSTVPHHWFLTFTPRSSHCTSHRIHHGLVLHVLVTLPARSRSHISFTVLLVYLHTPHTDSTHTPTVLGYTLVLHYTYSALGSTVHCSPGLRSFSSRLGCSPDSLYVTVPLCSRFTGTTIFTQVRLFVRVNFGWIFWLQRFDFRSLHWIFYTPFHGFRFAGSITPHRSRSLLVRLHHSRFVRFTLVHTTVWFTGSLPRSRCTRSYLNTPFVRSRVHLQFTFYGSHSFYTWVPHCTSFSFLTRLHLSLSVYTLPGITRSTHVLHSLHVLVHTTTPLHTSLHTHTPTLPFGSTHLLLHTLLVHGLHRTTTHTRSFTTCTCTFLHTTTLFSLWVLFRDLVHRFILSSVPQFTLWLLIPAVGWISPGIPHRTTTPHTVQFG